MNDTKVTVELEAQKAIQTTNDLRKALKLAKDEMVGLEEGSQAFLEAANRAGELKHLMDEINRSVRGASSDFGDIVGQIGNIGASMTGAFQAAQGAMNLMGVESENVAEAIKKMLSLMAMTQGLASIDKGIKAFKTLATTIKTGITALKGMRAVLVSTGIGAIAVAVGILAANWDKVSKWLGIAKPKIEDNTEALKRQEEQARKLNSALDKLNTTQEKYSDIVEGRVVSGLNKEARARYDELKSLESELKAKREVIKSEIEYAVANGASREELKDLNDELKDNTDDLINNNNAISKLLRNKNNYIATLGELKEEWAKLSKEIELHNKSFERGIKDESDALANYVLPKTKSALEEFREENTLVYDGLTQAADGFAFLSEQASNFDLLPDSFESSFSRLTSLLDFARNSMDAFGTSGLEAGDKAALGLQIAGAAAQTIGGILNDIAKDQDAQSEESFEKLKKLQIGAAVMNMLGGIVSAIASCWSPANAWQTSPVQAVMAAVNAASVATMGGIQIAQISKRKFGDTSVPKASVRSSATSNVSSPVQYTQDIRGAEISSRIADTRVYVTESDISGTQHRVDVAESESRF